MRARKLIPTGWFYFIVESVDLLWKDLKDKCHIEYTIENFQWEMREFAIRDNNGYILQFGEDIKEISQIKYSHGKKQDNRNKYRRVSFYQ